VCFTICKKIAFFLKLSIPGYHLHENYSCGFKKREMEIRLEPKFSENHPFVSKRLGFGGWSGHAVV